ncbi:MAG: 4a-hydroxytetrahydrobiopterin dehydratase [Nitrososphaerota archaeon]|nr:4a-hydroxytetrahydrobiopterin dehydratase [Nitrososphaerota archaeon]MDG6938808.1 4a-hydroxytetrahydrobiopterin dehydratase [Nitrososphaerota archaeon]
MPSAGKGWLERAVAGLDGWRLEGDFLVKTFEFETFMDGIRFVGRVARIAERLEHHPDVHIRYTSIKLALQSHDVGGVTERDVRLAGAIDKSLKAAAG